MNFNLLLNGWIRFDKDSSELARQLNCWNMIAYVCGVWHAFFFLYEVFLFKVYTNYTQADHPLCSADLARLID